MRSVVAGIEKLPTGGTHSRYPKNIITRQVEERNQRKKKKRRRKQVNNLIVFLLLIPNFVALITKGDGAC